MPLSVVVESENCRVLRRLPSDNDVVLSLFGRASVNEKSLLQYIDPFGDVVFNQLQLGRVVQELRGLEKLAASEGEKQALSDVISFVESAVGETHAYVRFVGD